MVEKTATETERRTRKWRQGILDELVALAKSTQGTSDERGRRALELIEELKVTDNMLLHARPQPIIGDYSVYRAPREAVAAYLKLRETPATMDEIIDGVFAGGYRGGRKDEYALSVKLAVHQHLTGRARHHVEYGLKGRVGSLIGLNSWDDELFNL